MHKSSQRRKIKQRDGATGRLVGQRIALSPAGLAERRAAQRTVAIRYSAIPDSWQGQAIRSHARKLTGHVIEIDAGLETPHKLAIEKTVTTDQTDQFNRVIHVRGITARTWRESIGEADKGSVIVRPDGSSHRATLYGGKRLDDKSKIRAASPSQDSEDYDPLYHSKVLLQTRKGRKLAQRAVSGATIVLPSAGQLERYGMTEKTVRSAPEETETVSIDCAKHAPQNTRYFDVYERAARARLLIDTITRPHAGPRCGRAAYYAMRHADRLAARIAFTVRMLAGPARLLLTA